MHDSFLCIAGWSSLTILVYLFSRWLYRRQQVWWTSPMLLAPLSLILIVAGLHLDYHQYCADTHWLAALFAPATVAFALPIYEQRLLIRRHWRLLFAGALIGSLTAIITSWTLATLLGLDADLRLSLLPRSFSTPFAMVVSARIGGEPSITALFVLLTGVLGVALGETLLAWLPVRSDMARGALFGMGAHAFGSMKAHQLSPAAGSVAALVMIFVGLLNVITAPLLAHFVQ